MKPTLTNRPVDAFASAALVMVLSICANAADGTWNQSASGGLWSNSANWSGGTIADGSGFTANFNTLDLTGDNTVHLDGARTLTNLVFGDANTGTSGSWILGNNSISTNKLILAGTTPTITVNALGTGSTATISAIIDGTAGLTKSGAGTLTLSGANTYTGATVLGQGALVFGVDQSPGAITLGGTAGSTNAVSLDLTTASATVAGTALVRTNNTTANTVSIGSGKTLTLNGGLTMGYDAAGGSGATASNLTVSGSGSLAINGTTVNIGVQQAVGNASYYSTATLDLTALGTGFSANVTDFKIGVSSDFVTGAVGTVKLSNVANTLVAKNLTVGKTGTSNSKGLSSLVLGTGTNVLQADTLIIGSGKNNTGAGTGLVEFASKSAGSPGTVTISNQLGTGAANIHIGETASGETTAAGATGTLDLRGHVATVNAGTLRIGSNEMNSNSGSTNGTLSFDAGSLTVTTLNMAPKSNGGTGTANATVNVGGGSFTVNTGGAFTLGSQAGNGASVATLNLTGGVFTSNVDILDGGGTSTSTINLNGGTLDMKGRAIGSATVAIDALNFNSGTLKNVSQINNGAGLTKATAGTLILDGTNSYSGATTVSAGILRIDAAQSAAIGNVGVSGSGTRLIGTGTIGGNTSIGAGSIHSAGGSIANTDKVGLQAFDQTGAATTNLSFGAGSIFEWDLNAKKDTDGMDGNLGTTADNGARGTDYDAVDVTGTLTIDSTAIFRVVLGSSATGEPLTFWQQTQIWDDIFGGGFTLSNGTGFNTGLLEIVDSAGNNFNPGNLNPGYGFSISGTTLTWSAVPEPTSALTGLLLAAGLLRRRR